VGDLKLNSELCKIAERWAERLASRKKLEHSGDKYKGEPLGENLAFRFSSQKAGYPGLQSRTL